VAGDSERERLKILKIVQWAISSEASLETEMNVQRLLKVPNVKPFSSGGNYGTSKP
jgi:hypothetical protein